VWDAGVVDGYVLLTSESWAADTGCNGGFALCATESGMTAEPLEGMCNSSGYRMQEDETHCGQ
jgi:hypothetical protein